MPPSGFFVDSGLLVLFVAGTTDPAIIAKHRRLAGYSTDDFDLLTELIDLGGGVVHVTPNTLAETSNLLGQHGEPERSALMQKLGELIEHSQEIVVLSKDAAQHPRFEQLGLTDATLLEVVSEDRPLLTVDFDLFLAAVTVDERTAVNFNHHRSL